MNDFELYPSPYRKLDAQASIIDQLITYDDVSDETNLVRDIVQITGSIGVTNEDYCMYPMFRVIPGFISDTHMLHGNDGK